ncbi:hypothetical protein LT493_44210 [Streptomyces tricolor]|nr:hypothetical protein [Streptomyces tricolor]
MLFNGDSALRMAPGDLVVGAALPRRILAHGAELARFRSPWSAGRPASTCARFCYTRLSGRSGSGVAGVAVPDRPGRNAAPAALHRRPTPRPQHGRPRGAARRRGPPDARDAIRPRGQRPAGRASSATSRTT